MSANIERIRTSIDQTLDTLQARAEALHAQYCLNQAKRAARIEQRKQALREALEKMRAALRDGPGLAAQSRQKLVAAIDELRLQAHLAKAEHADRLEAEHQRLKTGLRQFEQRIEQIRTKARPGIDWAGDLLTREYTRARDELNAELEAARARFKEEAEQGRSAFTARKNQIAQRVGGLIERLAAQRKALEQKLKEFETQAKPGVAQIGKALKELVS